MNVSFFGPARLSPADKKILTAAALAALGRKAGLSGETSIIFLSDSAIRALNKRHLGHDRPTDVISFSYEGSLPKGARAPDAPFADIYVGLETAKRQAKEQGHPLFQELALLTVHGALHLAGYDDGTPAEKKRMFARQDRIVQEVLGLGKKAKAAPSARRR